MSGSLRMQQCRRLSESPRTEAWPTGTCSGWSASLNRRDSTSKTHRCPQWLRHSYSSALQALVALSIERLPTETDEATARQIIGVIALGKGFSKLGRRISEFSAEEIEGIYTELYGDG